MRRGSEATRQLIFEPRQRLNFIQVGRGLSWPVCPAFGRARVSSLRRWQCALQHMCSGRSPRRPVTLTGGLGPGRPDDRADGALGVSTARPMLGRGLPLSADGDACFVCAKCGPPRLSGRSVLALGEPFPSCVSRRSRGATGWPRLRQRMKSGLCSCVCAVAAGRRHGHGA